jgi:hypothetical protein
MKVAWLTWMPVNGWAARELQKHLNGKGEAVELVTLPPQRNLSPARALRIVEELSREYDAVAFIANPVLIEAARNFKIKNYQWAKEHNSVGVTFARWFCPDFYGKVPGQTEGVRWCQVS